MSKAKSERVHAFRRCRERFGINLSKKRHDEIVRQIEEGSAKFIEKQSNRVYHYETKLEGVKMRIVYDKFRRRIITVLYCNENLKTAK